MEKVERVEIIGNAKYSIDELQEAKDKKKVVGFRTTDGKSFCAIITAITHMPGRVGNLGIKAKTAESGEYEYEGWYNWHTCRGALN